MATLPPSVQLDRKTGAEDLPIIFTQIESFRENYTHWKTGAQSLRWLCSFAIDGTFNSLHELLPYDPALSPFKCP